MFICGHDDIHIFSHMSCEWLHNLQVQFFFLLQRKKETVNHLLTLGSCKKNKCYTNKSNLLKFYFLWKVMHYLLLRAFLGLGLNNLSFPMDVRVVNGVWDSLFDRNVESRPLILKQNHTDLRLCRQIQ